MGKTGKANYIVIILIILLSFTKLFGLNIAGLCIPLGIAAYFTDMAVKKESIAGSVLDIKAIKPLLKNVSIWLWIILPLFMNVLSILAAKQFFPDYITHIVSSSEGMAAVDITPDLLFQFAIFALAEEITWRAFFQKQLQKRFRATAAIIASSILFAIAHYTSGSVVITAYDLFFVFVNSCIYAVIFHKTNNAWISTISHSLANLFSILIVAFL